MARLRGDFTITMLVSFVRDQSDVDAFKSDLARIEGLTTSVRASSEDEDRDGAAISRESLTRSRAFCSIGT